VGAGQGGKLCRVQLNSEQVSLESLTSSFNNNQEAVRYGQVPVWVLEGVRSRQVPPEVVPQQDHGLQAQLGSPLLYGLHKLRLGLRGVRREGGPAALAEAQKVQGVDGPLLGQGVQVVGPETHAAAEAVQQHQRRSGPGLGQGALRWRGVGSRDGGGIVVVEGQRPQVVASGDTDMLPGEGLFHA